MVIERYWNVAVHPKDSVYTGCDGGSIVQREQVAGAVMRAISYRSLLRREAKGSHLVMLEYVE